MLCFVVVGEVGRFLGRVDGNLVHRQLLNTFLPTTTAISIEGYRHNRFSCNQSAAIYSVTVLIDPTALPVRNQTLSDGNELIYTIHHTIQQFTDGLTYEKRVFNVQHALLAKYSIRTCNVDLLLAWNASDAPVSLWDSSLNMAVEDITTLAMQSSPTVLNLNCCMTNERMALTPD